MDERRHRPHSTTQRFRDVRIVKALVEPQHDRGSLAVRQLFERVEELVGAELDRRFEHL